MAEDRFPATQAATQGDRELGGGTVSTRAAIVVVSRDAAALHALDRELAKR